MNLPPYKLVTNPSDWQVCLAQLQKHPRLAIDLEANSLFAYRERVCLIQISIPNQDYIVDPLAKIELSPLGAIIRDPAVEKIFHAAEYDLLLIKREFGWRLQNLFDTMWATRILGYDRCGLANILESFYGVKLDKKHQRANWCKRPLTTSQLAYARMDTHYLLRLRDDLAAELGEAGRMAEARETFAEQSDVHPNNNEFDPDDFWSINGIRKLSGREQAIARELSIYRDQQARRRDRPHFKVFDNRTLLELAVAAPHYLDEMQAVHGMSKGQIRRYGRPLLNIIQRGQQAPLPQKPRRNNRRQPEAVYKRYDKLHAWRKQRAQKRGVESDVIVSREALWTIARANPKTMDELSGAGAVGPWRLETYGQDILKKLQDR